MGGVLAQVHLPRDCGWALSQTALGSICISVNPVLVTQLPRGMHPHIYSHPIGSPQQTGTTNVQLDGPVSLSGVTYRNVLIRVRGYLQRRNDPDTAASPSPPSMGEAHRAENQELPEQPADSSTGWRESFRCLSWSNPSRQLSWFLLAGAVVSESLQLG